MMTDLRRMKELLISGMAWTSGLCVFIPLGISILIASLIKNPKRFDRFIKACCRLVLRFLFIRIKIEGLDNFQKNKTYLSMSNHINLFDVFVLYGYIPNFVRLLSMCFNNSNLVSIQFRLQTVFWRAL